MRTRVSSLMVVAIVIGLLFPAVAEIPQVITYQGKVTDAGGVPVADGDYTMTFDIYDAATSGTSLWSSGALTVTVSGGVFSVVLGESPQPALSLVFDADYWVETSIEGDVQTPRARLGSVGYAYMASGLVAGTEVEGSVSSGNLAVLSGTNSSTVNAARGLYGSASGATGRGVEGWATSSTGYTFGGRFESQSTDGRGVLGHASASTGTTYGVRGTCNSPAGTAVCGVALATAGTTYGVFGETYSTDGYAGYFEGNARVTGDMTVDGSLNAPGLGDITAVNAGTGLTGGGTTGAVTLNVAVPLSLNGSSANAIVAGTNSGAGSGLSGVQTASTGTTYGVRGTSSSTSGYGVYGSATATTGTTYGVYGQSNSTAGYAGYFSGNARVTGNMTVDGSLSAPGLGDITAVNAGTGLTGGGTTGAVTLNVAVPLSLTGSVNNAMIEGTNASSGLSAFGLSGRNTAASGLTCGIYGISASTDGQGIFGAATASTGVTFGVYGRVLSSAGYAVYYSGGLAGTGTKSCVVKTSKGPTLMYCQESPENWFEDFGEGQLVGGRCHIELDPVFLETVTVDDVNPMQVFQQPYHRSCAGLVVERGATGFDVYNPLDPSAAGNFGYRVVAKRKGFEQERLEYCKAAERDSYLYPELREKEREAAAPQR